MWVLFLILQANAYFLPGVAPKSYEQDRPLNLYVNKLDSSKTQLPFDYYYLNYCKPRHINTQSENIGQTLSGDTIESSPYQIHMGQVAKCQTLCTQVNRRSHVRTFKWMIENEYKASWLLDNLPAGFRQTINKGDLKTKISYYQDGFPIGFREGRDFYVNNHHHIVIKIHPNSKDEDKWKIVGFLVEPLSLLNTNERLGCETPEFLSYEFGEARWNETIMTPADRLTNSFPTRISSLPAQNLENPGSNITFTYSVIFEESDVKWADRWDYYLYMTGESGEVHWLSIINSFAMVLFLTGMVAHIFRRIIKKDINRYNEGDEIDPEGESGWKQVKGDIFRPPIYGSIFSIIIGSGVQVIGMAILTLLFACIGFLTPANRGALITAMLILYVFMGVFAGYTSSRLYKFYGGSFWKRNAFGTAFFFPGICFLVFFIVNLFILGEESSGAVPFTSLLELLVLWFGISVPLVLLGSAIGFRKNKIEHPCKINKIPKPIEIIPGSFKINAICLMAGSLPFGCMFIELSYVMKSLWHHTLFYYLFGFLFLCFIVLIITSAEVSILMTYIILCREDYRWWWASFSVAGSSGLYLFLYSIIYFMTDLTFSRFSSIVIYFGYMLLTSVAYALITGTIGFFATFIFIRSIYSNIKIS
ncbi:unnamed protein product [Blepharisma stoltei]|uniref:Transmembrane 9 superfamily member n=1 Tax=Blepharisma stoltei TaxID=1481888 RepID=A0AAU9J2I3_9CILI|nr:unnamed protein product [Blepharisma stoltei]